MVGFVKRYWFLVLCLALAAGGIGILVLNQINKAKGKPYTVKKVDLVETLSFSGQIDAEEKGAMVFQTTGKLSFVKVNEGDRVVKGQLLAGLDTGDLAAAEKAAYYKYLAADANAKYIEDTVKDHDKDETFLQKNNRVAAQTDRDIKYDAWLTAQRALRHATLYSPVNGIVSNTSDAQPGEFITATNQIRFDVVNPETIFFSANADQSDVVRLAVGKAAKITLDSYPDKPINAVVTKISFTPRTDETGTVYEIRLAFDRMNQDYQLRIGMTGDVNFVLSEKKDIVAISTKYIKTADGHKTVSKQVGGSVVKTEVKVGETIEGQTEILSGLSSGDVIYDQTK